MKVYVIGIMYLVVGRLLTPKSINVELFKQFSNIKYLRTTAGSPTIIRLLHKFVGTFLGQFECLIFFFLVLNLFRFFWMNVININGRNDIKGDFWTQFGKCSDTFKLIVMEHFLKFIPTQELTLSFC